MPGNWKHKLICLRLSRRLRTKRRQRLPLNSLPEDLCKFARMRGARLLAPKYAPEFDIGRRLQISASINGGYDDNVLLTPNGSPSWFANPNANLSYQFGSARLAVDLLTSGGIIYYFDHPGGLNYDPIVSLDFPWRIKLRCA